MKRVRMSLKGRGEEPLALLEAFKEEALGQGWPANDVRAVILRAACGDLDHVLRTLAEFVEEPVGRTDPE